MTKRHVDYDIVLDRIISFVSNCDTKASIILSLYSLLLTIVLEKIILLIDVIKTNTNNQTNLSCAQLCLITLIFASLAAIIYSIVELILSLKATIKESDNHSVIYFTDIASNEEKKYIEILSNISEKDYKIDLGHQIHINSTICVKKFKRYNRGLLIGMIGYLAFFLFHFIYMII